ncbi:DNA-deoxyinosine glycosylase [Rheinheimera sp. 4Y26]|uniref:DNA-deoxyinosine glycosylase n=1 Tax=Rheinheimera sp. 4Y26 TaxID=2977811 RepID=UPI0021B0E221|nr:DNA-deoxyinosine glycosylase [Rheinheimera sp. 4Y26]MCT6698266.1 DNA-deoxyinosine glycosylase [Rheinheimera sp. 4Y26]
MTIFLPLLSGLAPVARPDAKILILGSMPGQASLDAQQYYGHPRNQFWPLMQQLFVVDASLPYPQRLLALQNAGVALWDVIGLCQRQGSLDSAIRPDSVQFNDIAGLLTQLPKLKAVWLNGGTAAKSWQKLQKSGVTIPAGIKICSLPSSSPAHAARSFSDKLLQWQQAWLQSLS